MAAVAGAYAGLLALLSAAGEPPALDCVCRRLDAADRSAATPGEQTVWVAHCAHFCSFWLRGRCATLEAPSVAAAAVARLAPRGWAAAQGEGEGCGAAVDGLRRLTPRECWHLERELPCRVAADRFRSCALLQGVNDTEWTAETLSSDGLRQAALSRLLRAVRCSVAAVLLRTRCYQSAETTFLLLHTNKTAFLSEVPAFLRRVAAYWRDAGQLFSLGAAHISKLFIPLAFEHMGNLTSDQELHGWIKNMEHLRDMLDLKVMAIVHDVHSSSELIVNYRLEEYKTDEYVLRRPLLNHELTGYTETDLSFRDDFSELCVAQQPQAVQMFALADAVYAFYRQHYLNILQFQLRFGTRVRIKAENLPRGDGSNSSLSVDTECVQLLVDALDRPRCPLEGLPPESSARRRQCRQQLWEDLLHRTPAAPVTSYLAYTQRASVNLCLLAWMAANSLGVCQDVPFSMIQSVHDARCFFDNPNDGLCPESNATAPICSVLRTILLLQCGNFYSVNVETHDFCTIFVDAEGRYVHRRSKGKGGKKPTDRTLNYKDTLNKSTLKYKDFKIDFLKPLEITFIAVNIIFRFLSASVYLYLPHLRNLPGKILLSYQTTGIIQIVCSEVLYRMAGVPDLSTAVLIDGALTLLSCLWLNSFCYQMYGYIRHLRLPNDLPPDVASRVFRRQVLSTLVPWSVVCAVCFALEKSSKYYLIHSRVLLLIGISLSIAFNLVCLGLVGYMYLRTKKSMQQLEIISSKKLGSKKQILYLSVKTVILSGIGILIRVGFHQSQGIAQIVYYVHIATMIQGPVLFVFFVCNGSTVSVLRNRLLAWWNPDVINPGQELCSSAERNLAKRINQQSPAVESSL